MKPSGLLRVVAAPFRWAAIAVWGTLGARIERRPLLIVQGVIEGPEGVLLAVRHDLRGWGLPGGTVERGESEADALRREVREEIGVEVAVGAPVGRYVRTGFRPHEARVYRCRIRSGSPRATKEALRVAWFPPDAPPDTLLPWCRAPLADARAPGAAPTRHEHQGAPEILQTMRIDLQMRGRG